MAGYTEYRHWSQTLGCEAARLSMFDQNGDEFFSIIPVGELGKAYRLARQEAVARIMDVMEAGREPGEVFDVEPNC